MRVTSKGQVTIPKAIRERTGIGPGTEVEFAIEQGAVMLRPSASRGTELVEHLRAHRAEFVMSTEEIMTLTRGESPPDGA